MDVENTDLDGAFWRTNRSYRSSLPITKHHTLGANEQDYTDTAAYAEQFIQQVVPLRDKVRRSC